MAALLAAAQIERAGHNNHVVALRVPALAFIICRRVLCASLLETVVTAVLRAGLNSARATLVRALSERHWASGGLCRVHARIVRPALAKI